jgi:hypothetical protein
MKKIIGIFIVVILLLVSLVINDFKSDGCEVLDVNGNKTINKINVKVSSYSKTDGTVILAFSNDSDKPVNASITIKASSKILYSDQVLVKPFNSAELFSVGSWGGRSSIVSVSISDAKFLD